MTQPNKLFRGKDIQKKKQNKKCTFLFCMHLNDEHLLFSIQEPLSIFFNLYNCILCQTKSIPPVKFPFLVVRILYVSVNVSFMLALMQIAFCSALSLNLFVRRFVYKINENNQLSSHFVSFSLYAIFLLTRLFVRFLV